uniref:MaoC/PaaZ C-terminal domain-containing protein n=1 Tax=Escherichia coli TaxID=562 RepID=UPI0027D23672
MYDDVVIGVREELGSHTFTAEAIIAFARKYDPQPFHIDEEAARRSHFGGLIASGWHT